jgi:hypothetical protein
MLVCAIVGKQLPAIESTIEYVIPTVLHSDARDDSLSKSVCISDLTRQIKC